MSAAGWSVVQQVCRVLLASLFYFTIARMMRPAEFGVVGVATVWIALLGVYSERGFGAALIQHREIDARHLGTVFILNVALRFILLLLGAGPAAPASWLIRVPQAESVIIALSAGFVITSFSTVQSALAIRQPRFRALAVRDLRGVLVGSATGFGLAYAGYRVWSLVNLRLMLQGLTSA